MTGVGANRLFEVVLVVELPNRPAVADLLLIQLINAQQQSSLPQQP